MRKSIVFAAAVFLYSFQTWAADPPTRLNLLVSSNGNKTVSWPRVTDIPALESNRLTTGSSVTSMAEVLPSAVAVFPEGYVYSVSNQLSEQYFNLKLLQKNSNDLYIANLLNRIAYGPTPDELQRVRTIGPQAYIEEQLAPEGVATVPDAYISVTTNSITVPASTNWMFTTVTGLVSGVTGGTLPFYLYLTGAGEAFIDDIQLRVFYSVLSTNTNNVVTTNMVLSETNILRNGNFEEDVLIPGSIPGWIESTRHSQSSVQSTQVCEGTNALRIIATQGGTTGSEGIQQNITTNVPANGTRAVLSFWYLPRENSGNARVNMRFSGGGTIISDNDPPPAVTWYYATATGIATTTPTIYFYLSGSGECYIDDVKLVAGSVPGTGSNMLRNARFEAPLSAADWQRSADFTNSTVSNLRAYEGGGSLRLIATAGGSGGGDSVFQSNIGVANNQTYSVSFWYTIPTGGRTLTCRLSGSQTPGLLRTDIPDTSVASIKRRLDTIGDPDVDTGAVRRNRFGGAMLHDLRAWYILNSINSRRQLLEVLTQFFENHFVTEHAKSFDYFDGRYDDNAGLEDILAADWEYREVSKWRAKLLDPNCTFLDLLKISAESPAMIVYLDGVNSRADGNNVANENYARELFELFTMGVDNGYDQLDITAMSRSWTGWSVDIVDAANAENPFARRSTTFGFYPNTSGSGVSNIVGVWAFNYKTNFHGVTRSPILAQWATNASRTNLVSTGPKVVPARFGSRWAGQAYQLNLPQRTGTNGINDAYDVLNHLANLPFTMEYISVKLCRLLVHDGFPNPTTHTDLPEYAFYNYANPNMSPEAALVYQCMIAWDTPVNGRKGNIRSVLRTILNSELFRSHGGSLQKVKTPVEYAVSAIRALRSQTPAGTFTASSDGYSISGRSRTASSSPLIRMGNMRLFDRDAPDGYPEEAPPWISAGTLAERIRFIQTFLMSTSDTNKADAISGGNNNLSDPVALLKSRLPSTSWNNAGDVADFFISILYPGEGKANLDLYRNLAVQYLNISEDGTTVSPFSGLLPNTGAPYDTRVRSTVGMLMTLERFQEQ